MQWQNKLYTEYIYILAISVFCDLCNRLGLKVQFSAYFGCKKLTSLLFQLNVWTELKLLCRLFIFIAPFDINLFYNCLYIWVNLNLIIVANKMLVFVAMLNDSNIGGSTHCKPVATKIGRQQYSRNCSSYSFRKIHIHNFSELFRPLTLLSSSNSHWPLLLFPSLLFVSLRCLG